MAIATYRQKASCEIPCFSTTASLLFSLMQKLVRLPTSEILEPVYFVTMETNLAEPKTFGFELRSSMNVLRYQPIVDIGARCVFVNKVYNQNPILELILNYSF